MSNGLLAAFAFLGFFIFFILIAAVILYVLKSLGLYKLAQNANLPYPFLAWIPFGDVYLLGLLIKTLSIGSFEVPKIEWVLPLGGIISYILRNIKFIGPLVGIVYAVLFYFALYKFYKMYKPDQAVIWIILSIIFAFLVPIFIFVLRNEKPVTV